MSRHRQHGRTVSRLQFRDPASLCGLPRGLPTTDVHTTFRERPGARVLAPTETIADQKFTFESIDWAPFVIDDPITPSQLKYCWP